METEEDREFLQTMPFSPLAVELAEKILPRN
jgi:hypothetical protein